MYQILFSKSAIKSLESLPVSLRERIITSIDDLAKNPYTCDIRKLAGQSYFRMRVGDYRVIFSMEKKQLVILIIKIGHRKKIYKS